MTNGKIIFMPLGGAQEVGASCYFLKLGENNFLLDCGCGSTRGLKKYSLRNCGDFFI